MSEDTELSGEELEKLWDEHTLSILEQQHEGDFYDLPEELC